MVEAMLIPSAPELSARERVAQSIENNDECMGCHAMMNSLGRAFETYNHTGFFRAEDHGGPPDGSTVVDNLPDPRLNRAYGNAVEMVTAFAGSRHVERCFIRQMFRFFMGRDETAADACILSEMEAAYEETGGSFISMLERLVMSDTFRYRTRVQEQR
jgi:hypothetical protein